MGLEYPILFFIHGLFLSSMHSASVVPAYAETPSDMVQSHQSLMLSRMRKIKIGVGMPQGRGKGRGIRAGHGS